MTPKSAGGRPEEPYGRWRFDGADLLRRAIDHALPGVEAVKDDRLSAPTSCRAWNLGTLLRHLNASVAAIDEALTTGRVAPAGAGPGGGQEGGAGPAAYLVAAFRELALRIRDACVGGLPGLIVIGDLRLMPGIVAATGALEIAVHAWDIDHACGRHRRIPRDLAVDLLEICPYVVPADVRSLLFAPPVPIPASCDPGHRLVAFLGRRPCRTPGPGFDLDERLALVVGRLLRRRPPGRYVGDRSVGNDDATPTM